MGTFVNSQFLSLSEVISMADCWPNKLMLDWGYNYRGYGFRSFKFTANSIFVTFMISSRRPHNDVPSLYEAIKNGYDLVLFLSCPPVCFSKSNGPRMSASQVNVSKWSYYSPEVAYQITVSTHILAGTLAVRNSLFHYNFFPACVLSDGG